MVSNQTGRRKDEAVSEGFAIAAVVLVLGELGVAGGQCQGVGEVVGLGKGDTASVFVRLVEAENSTSAGLTQTLGYGVAGRIEHAARGHGQGGKANCND